METRTSRIMGKPSSTMLLVLISLLGLGLNGCRGVYINFSTPDSPPALCPIQELLLDVSAFPGDEWEETGSRSENAATFQMGIERIGTSFSSSFGGAFQEVYRFEDEHQAMRAYINAVESWFTPPAHRTEFITPQVMENLSVKADLYRVGCNDRKLGDREQCQYAAQYGPYITLFFGGMRVLTNEDFIELVEEVDRQALSCLGQN